MTIIAQANTSQLDEVEVTIDITMKLGEWKKIQEFLSTDNWVPDRLARNLEKVISEYHDKVHKRINPV